MTTPTTPDSVAAPAGSGADRISLRRTVGACLLAAVAGLGLVSCGGSGGLAPVGRPDTSFSGAPSHHYVVRGETLYAIAWRYGIDYRNLAAANGISPPYLIRPGQKLQIAAARDVSRRPAVTGNRTRPPRETRASQRASPRPAPPPGPVRGPSRRETSRDRAPASGGGSSRWRWPVAGKVVSTFRQTGNRGLDIAGRLGQPVQAAAAGRVVYSGGGLRGYGKLIIIKHDKRFLSAYAHNNKLLVGEGDEVGVGERIAEMGDTGTDRVKLHFEIRRDGKPVDPQKYLPR